MCYTCELESKPVEIKGGFFNKIKRNFFTEPKVSEIKHADIECDEIMDVKNIHDMQSLAIRNCPNIDKIENCPGLRKLIIDRLPGYIHLESLVKLEIGDATRRYIFITGLNPEYFPCLKTLTITNYQIHGFEDFQFVSSITFDNCTITTKRIGGAFLGKLALINCIQEASELIINSYNLWCLIINNSRICGGKTNHSLNVNMFKHKLTMLEIVGKQTNVNSVDYSKCKKLSKVVLDERITVK